MSKPIRVYRGSFGTWFGTSNYTETSPGSFRADNQIEIENQDDLTKLADDAGLWRELQSVSGKTAEEIFDACGLILTKKP